MAAMLLALLLAAQAVPAACPPTPAPLPAEYAGWNASGSIAAAAEPAAVADALLTVGQGVRATLPPAGALKLPVTPKRPLTATSHGGLFAFEAASAGRYRVALGSGLWVEVIANGASLPSVAHGHGPACSPIRKAVEWDLRPGRYLLQLTGEPASVQVQIIKVS